MAKCRSSWGVIADGSSSYAMSSADPVYKIISRDTVWHVTYYKLSLDTKLAIQVDHASVLAVVSLVGLDSVVSIYKQFLAMGTV